MTAHASGPGQGAAATETVDGGGEHEAKQRPAVRTTLVYPQVLNVHVEAVCGEEGESTQRLVSFDAASAFGFAIQATPASTGFGIPARTPASILE